MRVFQENYCCPDTFDIYGPVCIAFHYPIQEKEKLFDWVEDRYGGDQHCRVWYSCERMISKPLFKVYLDNDNDAMVFKLTFGGE